MSRAAAYIQHRGPRRKGLSHQLLGTRQIRTLGVHTAGQIRPPAGIELVMNGIGVCTHMHPCTPAPAVTRIMRYGEQGVSMRCEHLAVVDGAATPLSPKRTDRPAAPELYAAALERARAGDREAFRILVLAHQSRVYSLAARMLGRREDAQELTQDVFLLLHRSLSSIVSSAHLRHWLHRTVCHRAIDRLRRRPTMRLLPLEAAEAIEERAADEDPSTARLLRALIEQLQPMAKAVMLLRYQEDLDPTQIAHVLGIPLNTVKSHLRRSLTWLRRRCSQLQFISGGGADD